MAAPLPLETALRKIGDQFQAVTGTIHALQADGQLHLTAAFGVPESLRPTIERIPIGKGLAGLAAQRREPVTVCNLQTDSSGVVRPGAKITDAEAAIAIPILDDSQLIGVLGIGRAQANEFTAEEIKLLSCAADKLFTKSLPHSDH